MSEFDCNIIEENGFCKSSIMKITEDSESCQGSENAEDAMAS